MSARDAGFEFIEGATSDLAFVAHGPRLEDAFAGAAEALLAATVEQPDSVRGVERRRLEIEEPELELLLLSFLNELIYLRDADALLLRARSVAIEPGAPARLRAELEGERIDRDRHQLESEVKAATAHGLRVVETDDGWQARVTLDV